MKRMQMREGERRTERRVDVAGLSGTNVVSFHKHGPCRVPAMMGTMSDEQAA